MLRLSLIRKDNLLMLMLIFLLALVFFLLPTVAKATTITVQGFTNTAIQNAINQASAGDTVYLPAGNYNFTGTVYVNKAVTIKGAAQLQNLCIPEYGTSFAVNIPPFWSSTPSHCYTNNLNLMFFNIKTTNVRFESLKFTGVTIPSAGENMAIASYGYDNISVYGCECLGQYIAILFKDSYNNLVQKCYLHDNYRDGLGYGVHILGPKMETGGASVIIKECEFMKNRHDICTNSPLSRWIAENNYFHDNDTILKLASVDIHPQGSDSICAAVRNNIFVRTCPIMFKSGSAEVTGNYYDSTCGISSIASFKEMIHLAPPTFDGNFTGSIVHDVYISGNANSSPLLKVGTYNYSGTTRYVTYNVYVNGVLWESQHTSYPPRATSPRPLLGEAYITDVGTSKKVEKLESNRWYDLHALACDPQGADNIARIGVQIVDKTKYTYTPGNTNGVFSSDGNYYIETDGNRVYIRKNEGTGTWTEVANASEDLYVDSNYFSYVTDGSHRKHFTIRFKVLESSESATWQIHGYARDAQGNLPHDNWYEGQIGWAISNNNFSLPTGTPSSDLPNNNGSGGYYSPYTPKRTPKPAPPKERPAENTVDNTDNYAAWQESVRNHLNSNLQVNKPNIAKIPDIIDIILYMQDPDKYPLGKVPKPLGIYDLRITLDLEEKEGE